MQRIQLDLHLGGAWQRMELRGSLEEIVDQSGCDSMVDEISESGSAVSVAQLMHDRGERAAVGVLHAVEVDDRDAIKQWLRPSVWGVACDPQSCCSDASTSSCSVAKRAKNVSGDVAPII